MTQMTWLADLGTRDYKEVWDLQKELVQRRLAGDIQDVLILVEHPEVITLGKRGKPDDVFTSEIPVYTVERGGEATYHGPGQLVGYPIFSLQNWPSGVMSFVRGLEDVLINASKDSGVDAGRNPIQTGVWVGGRKLASIGLAVKNGVTYHGFAVNVNTDLSRFRLLKPCGFDGSIMTSISDVAGRRVVLDDFKKDLLKRFQEHFGVKLESAPADLVNKGGYRIR